MKRKWLLKKEVAEQGANVTEVGGSSTQPFNIKNAFQSVMSKLTTIELEQVEFREFATIGLMT